MKLDTYSPVGGTVYECDGIPRNKPCRKIMATPYRTVEVTGSYGASVQHFCQEHRPMCQRRPESAASDATWAGYNATCQRMAYGRWGSGWFCRQHATMDGLHPEPDQR